MEGLQIIKNEVSYENDQNRVIKTIELIILGEDQSFWIEFLNGSMVASSEMNQTLQSDVLELKVLTNFNELFKLTMVENYTISLFIDYYTALLLVENLEMYLDIIIFTDCDELLEIGAK